MTFKNNKYTKWYTALVSNASSKQRSKSDSYFELHHIIPTSLNGPNTKVNKVLLTAKEHFIAHLLLTKMVDGQNRHKMICALNRMMTVNEFQQREYTSAQYQLQRKIFSRHISLHNLGRKHTDEAKAKMAGRVPWNKGMRGVSEETSAKMRANNKRANLGKPLSAERKSHLSSLRKGEKNPFYGKQHSAETRQKIAKSHTGKTMPEVTRRKISETKQSRKLREPEWPT